MDNTVSTDNSSETGENPLKTRLANMLINRVTLSESLSDARHKARQAKSHPSHQSIMHTRIPAITQAHQL